MVPRTVSLPVVLAVLVAAAIVSVLGDIHGNFKASLGDQAQLVEAGYDGLYGKDTLSARIVFHNDTTSYPTWAEAKICVRHLCDLPYCPCTEYEHKNVSLATNENKLLGFTRGMVPVMDRSCMFAWRRSLPDELHEPAGMIRVFGYGWKDSHTKPWQHPEQNPDMGLLEPQHPYVFTVQKLDTLCTYSIVDALNGALVANATTPQLPGGLTDGVRFALYFGGEVPATQPVTVSYTQDPRCLMV